MDYQLTDNFKKEDKMSKSRHPYTFSLDETENKDLEIAKKNCVDGKLITIIRTGIAHYVGFKTRK